MEIRSSIRKNNLIKDVAIIVLSVLVAVLLVQTGAIKGVLTSTQEMRLVGSFVAGVFFTSIFTTAPATVALAEVAQANSIFLTALFGGLGALFGDLILFRFVRNRLSEDFLYLVKQSGSRRLRSIFRLSLFKWLVPFVGALVIASPLPDELGLAMMGLSKMENTRFIPISFALNFFGIVVIGLIARAV